MFRTKARKFFLASAVAVAVLGSGGSVAVAHCGGGMQAARPEVRLIDFPPPPPAIRFPGVIETSMMVGEM